MTKIKTQTYPTCLWPHMEITDNQIKLLSLKSGYDFAILKAIIEVESGGIGFAPDTGKLIIQFEPIWFRRYAPYMPSGLWSINGVERQAKEWAAFNNAFSLDPVAAMESTSIGMMQVMGMHWKMLGFTSVGEMWDYAKTGIEAQVDLAIRFIKSNKRLDKAVKDHYFGLIAYYYNGSGYKKFGYDKKLYTAFKKYS